MDNHKLPIVAKKWQYVQQAIKVHNLNSIS
jgi:hypothetical protein